MRKLGEVERQRQSMVILTFSFCGWAGLGRGDVRDVATVPTTNKTMAPYNSFIAPAIQHPLPRLHSTPHSTASYSTFIYLNILEKQPLPVREMLKLTAVGRGDLKIQD